MQVKKLILVFSILLLALSLPLMATGAKEILEEEKLSETVNSVDVATPNYAAVDKTDLIQAFNYAYSYMTVQSLYSQGISINGAYWLRAIDDAENMSDTSAFLLDTSEMESAISSYTTDYYQAGLKDDAGAILSNEELANLSTPETLLEKFSYAYSLIYTAQLKYMNGLDISAPEFKQGAADALYNVANPLMTTDECQSAVENYAAKLDEEYEEYLKVVSEENLKAAEEFLATNKGNEEMIELPSGDLMEIVSEDEELGATPSETNSVIVDYDLYLLDGSEIDSGTDVTFDLQNLIPGFVEAVTNMKVGQECYVYIHPDYGYGEQNTGTIPPQSLLVFRIYLKGIATPEVTE